MRATSVENKNETYELIKRSKAVNVFACTFRSFCMLSLLFCIRA